MRPPSTQAGCGDALGVGAVVVACRIAEDIIVVGHSGGKAVTDMRQRGKGKERPKWSRFSVCALRWES